MQIKLDALFLFIAFCVLLIGIGFMFAGIDLIENITIPTAEIIEKVIERTVEIPKYIIITSTPIPTEIPPAPQAEIIIPTPTAHICNNYARLYSVSDKQIATPKFDLKARIVNSGNCKWENYRLVSLNSSIEIPIGDVSEFSTTEVTLTMKSPSTPGKYYLDMILLDGQGNMILFNNTDDGLLHWEFEVPTKSQNKIKDVPGYLCIGST